jgi:hypothetical protein
MFINLDHAMGAIHVYPEDICTPLFAMKSNASAATRVIWYSPTYMRFSQREDMAACEDSNSDEV